MEKDNKKLPIEIKITILEDFRKFKKGEEINIKLKPFGITYIVGSNGSGKSTILQALRLQGDKLSEINKYRSDGIRPHAFDVIENDVLPKIKIEGFDFDEVYALDAVLDDPQFMENSITAGSFIEGGGYQLQRASKGEKSIFMLDRFRNDIKKSLGDSLKDNSFLDKTRIFLIDEIDEGLDLRFQFKYNTILENMFSLGFGGYVLVVSHNILCMLSNVDSTLFKPNIYDLDNRKMTTEHEYIQYKTNGEFDFDIVKLKENDK